MTLRLTIVMALATIGLALAAPARAQNCPPNFEAGHRVVYYDVSGRTEEDLEKSLNRAAPSSPHGEVFYGSTRWCIRWIFVPWRRRGECELVHISTVRSTKVLLPRWVDSEEAPEDLKKWWAVFSKVLEEHENAHVERSRAAEAAIAKALSSHNTGAACGVTASRANRIAQELYFEYIAEDQAFDRDTRHGLEQLEEALAEQ